MALTLPELPYAYDALEPYIDAQTMQLHHDKHHAAYVSKANDALQGTDLGKTSDAAEVCRNLSKVPSDKRTAVRNNAGGAFNHALFWQIMKSPKQGGGGEPSGPVMEAITSAFGDFNAFKEKFENAGATRFGSGWAWLCVMPGGKVEICSTANQDNPLMKDAIGDAAGCGGQPVLGLDVWEHAYYLKYQNRRPEYLKAWWNVVNWPRVNELYEKARG